MSYQAIRKRMGESKAVNLSWAGLHFKTIEICGVAVHRRDTVFTARAVGYKLT